MFFPMRRWITIWACAGVLLAGAAYRFAPHSPERDYVRLVLTVFPWAALWASLVANAALPSSLRRVHHVSAAIVERWIERLLSDEVYYQLRIHRMKSSTRPGRAQAALSEHETIVQALQSRNPDEAEAAMRRHIRNARFSAVAAIENRPESKRTPRRSRLTRLQRANSRTGEHR